VSEVFQSIVIGAGDEGIIVHPYLYEDHLRDFRPIGYFINGRWCMFEKPGELVALPLPHLPTR
jgi:hypothetical protein